MIEQWVQQLQSPDPQQRRQAIMALANARDLAALKPLAAVYHDDTEPALRDLALKAGRFIRQENDQSAGPQTAEAAGTPDDEAEAEAPPTGEVVSKRDAELAQFYLDAAMNYQTLGDRGRALEHLGKALGMNPTLAKETFVANLMTLAAGMPADEALPILLHPDRREALIAGVGGRRRLERAGKDPGVETATWENVALDFLVYWIVVSVCMAAIFVLVLNEIQDMLNDATVNTASGSSVDFGSLLTASVFGLILAAVFYGIMYTISMAIQGGAIHLTATYIFGGDNTLRYLYRRLVPFQMWAIFGMSAGLIVLMLFGSLTDTFFLMPLLMVAASVGVAWYTVELISKVYHFGWMSGCGTILIAGILLAVLSCGVNSLVFSIINALLGGG